MKALCANLGLCVMLAGCGLFGDTVEHPPAGGKGSPEYCAIESEEEDTCGACTAKPGCGWCAAPGKAAVACQPGTRTDHTPETCQVALAIGEPECPAPPL